jgi:hypothetical protein
MAALHPRSLLQTAILLGILALATVTTVFESPTGQLIGGAIIVVVALDIVWVTWRRFGASRRE